MNYSWELIVLVCVYITFLGSEDFSVIAEEEGSPLLEPNFSKPPYVYIYSESTTESSSRKKHNFSELKNNNMLRDKNAQSLVTDNVKSFLDMKRNPVLNKSDVAPAYLEPVQAHRVTTVSSYIDHVVSPLLNLFNMDFIMSNSTITVPKKNITSNNGLEENAETQSVPVPGSTTPNQIIAAPNRAINSTVSSPPPIRNLKDKDKIKPKIDPNSKQFKKTSSNFKNKSSVITNNSVSIESMKPENITEYSTDEATINDTMTTDNVTNMVSLIDETSEHSSSNATVSSLQTLPQTEGWAPLTLILIGVGVIALISIITAIGMFSVVLYKRYHWNKPQTFSDKCSNADSTGYIDDSTLKDNSEEMYSLDNDSFLNSLEAMTIQNYWADSIRHTKL